MARVSGFQCTRAREDIRRHAYSTIFSVSKESDRVSKTKAHDARVFPSDTKRTGER